MEGFSSAPPIPRKEMGGSHPGWNQGDRPLDAEENPRREPVSLKDGKSSKTAGAIQFNMVNKKKL